MRAVLAVGLAACTYSPPGAGDEPAPDAAPFCTTYSSFVDTCALPPGAPVELSGELTFDTNTGDLFRGAQPIEVETMTLATASGEIKALVASKVVIAPGSVLRAMGSRPFAIISSSSIELGANATIDVSLGGAGARASCPNPAAIGADRDGGAGGGGGGGFGGAGGTGTAGDVDGSTPAPGGAGGPAIEMPAGILGGCAGAAGGNDNNDVGGRGGLGGGAVYLVAATRIDLAANTSIDAAGEGGRGGEQHGLFNGDAGGGGGGSGGMIVIEAPTVVSLATLAANGGGGGEGSGNVDPGNPGERGALSIARAAGGGGRSTSGTDGGAGGAKPGVDGATTATALNGGGGGGGGGAGFIRILSPVMSIGSAISPEPQTD